MGWNNERKISGRANKWGYQIKYFASPTASLHYITVGDPGRQRHQRCDVHEYLQCIYSACRLKHWENEEADNVKGQRSKHHLNVRSEFEAILEAREIITRNSSGKGKMKTNRGAHVFILFRPVVDFYWSVTLEKQSFFSIKIPKDPRKVAHSSFVGHSCVFGNSQLVQRFVDDSQYSHVLIRLRGPHHQRCFAVSFVCNIVLNKWPFSGLTRTNNVMEVLEPSSDRANHPAHPWTWTSV